MTGPWSPFLIEQITGDKSSTEVGGELLPYTLGPEEASEKKDAMLEISASDSFWSPSFVVMAETLFFCLQTDEKWFFSLQLEQVVP